MAAVALNCCVCFGQSVWVGGIGGGRVTDDVTGLGATSVSKRYVLGPSLDLGLPLGFGFEADALYRRVGFSDQEFGGPIPERGSSWEFPLLLKYRLPLPLVKPFVEGGYAPRVLQGPTFDSGSAGSHGLVLGGGAQFGIGRLHLSPTVRYTRWNDGAVLIVYPNGPTIKMALNQVDILLGIAWKVR
jgi:hypothetical protein